MRKKIYLAAALMALALCLLSGCGRTEKEPEPTAAPVMAASAAPTEAPAETRAPTAPPAAAPTEEPTPEPTAEPTPEPTPETEPGPTPTPVAAGNYTYAVDGGAWTLQLREDDLFTLIDPDGGVHTGEGWSTEADGTVSCGPTDIYDAPFALPGGASRWRVEGERCTPVTP